jgi:hypothetical protein
MQKSIHNASFKTELAVQQIVNRLGYRINHSMLARIPGPGHTGLASPGDVYPIQSLPADQVNTYSAIEWIGYENDGFSATATPGWSGFADLGAAGTDFTKIVSTGSDLDTENTVLGNLYPGDVNNRPAIMFMGAPDYRTEANGTVYDYSALCMHQNNGCMFPVGIAGNTLTFHGGDRHVGQMKYTEFYQLAASAYAVVPENPHDVDGVDTWDLYFYSNYQPWEGENYTIRTGRLLARDVSVFRFKKETNAIRVKICVTQPIGDGAHTSICKEKAAIR